MKSLFKTQSGKRRPRLSWGSKVAASWSSNSSDSLESKRKTKKTKKRVRFDSGPAETFDSNYILDEELQKKLWYHKKDLSRIRAKIEDQLNKSIFEASARSKDEHCHRGLEVFLQEKMARLSLSYSFAMPLEPTQQVRQFKFTKELLEFQRELGVLGAIVETDEKIRQFCLRKSSSKLQAGLARDMGERDALAAQRIYEEYYNYKPTKQQQQHKSLSRHIKQGLKCTCNAKPTADCQVPFHRGTGLVRETSLGSRAA